MEFTTIIAPGEVARHLSDPRWVIIDCRSYLSAPEKGENEYRTVHIPGSHYAHLNRDLSSPVVPGVTGRHPLPPVPDFVALVRSWGVGPESQVIAYDQGNGGIAARLWWMLRWLGHDAVAVLDGGWNAWIDHRLPVGTDIPDKLNGTFKARERDWMFVDAAKVDEIRHLEAWNLVDARDQERYLGHVEPIDPVAGHIEGAINHPYSQNTDESGCWKAPEVLKDQFTRSGLTKAADKTVFYCGSGVTACHDVLAYKHAGLGDALLYPGSWSEWITL